MGVGSLKKLCCNHEPSAPVWFFLLLSEKIMSSVLKFHSLYKYLHDNYCMKTISSDRLQMCSRGLAVKMREAAATANLHDISQRWRFMEPKCRRHAQMARNSTCFYQLKLDKKQNMNLKKAKQKPG